MRFIETYHAPAYRSSDFEVLNDYKYVESQEFIKEIFNTLPHVLTVLNKNRQVIFTNSKTMELFGVTDIMLLLGKRPGEIVNCLHSVTMPAGCGTSENCRACGAVNTILESISTGKKVKNECRITIWQDGGEVTAAPFSFKENTYTIVSMIDISSEKRRRVLERIFFHDILNTAGNMAGLIEVINERDFKEGSDKLFKIVSGLSKDIIEEIQSQKV